MATVVALDIGEKRIGVAVASQETQLPRPLVTLTHDDQLVEALRRLCTEQQVEVLVAGLPRGLDGQETAQTDYARQVAVALAAELHLPLYFVDEALTSRQAEAELQDRGKPYVKGDIDALAATYILQDYFADIRSNLNEAA